MPHPARRPKAHSLDAQPSSDQGVVDRHTDFPEDHQPSTFKTLKTPGISSACLGFLSCSSILSEPLSFLAKAHISCLCPASCRFLFLASSTPALTRSARSWTFGPGIGHIRGLLGCLVSFRLTLGANCHPSLSSARPLLRSLPSAVPWGPSPWAP